MLIRKFCENYPNLKRLVNALIRKKKKGANYLFCLEIFWGNLIKGG